LFPGHNVVVCGWIKILFGQNDRHNKTDSVSRHRATWQQILFRAITLLFMVEFRYMCSVWYNFSVHFCIVFPASNCDISGSNILVLLNEMTDSLGLQFNFQMNLIVFRMQLIILLAWLAS